MQFTNSFYKPSERSRRPFWSVGRFQVRDSKQDVSLQGHDEIVWAVEVAGNRLLSASADKTIRMWDISSRRCEQVLEDHARPVLSLAVCGSKLFSGSYDYTIKVWSLDTLQRLKTLTGASQFEVLGH